MLILFLSWFPCVNSRVPDDLPLYDLLNEFQKGHSHMAVVVKQIKDASTTVEKFNTSGSETRTNRSQRRTDGTFLNDFLVNSL